MKTSYTFGPLLSLLCLLLIGSCKKNTSSSLEKNIDKKEISAKDCMIKVIAVDSAFGDVRNHASESISLSQTIKNYISSMDTYPYDNCPPDFTTAFKKHQEAWKGLLSITDKYPNQRGELHVIFEHIAAGDDATSFDTLLAQVLSTWTDVKKTMENSD